MLPRCAHHPALLRKHRTVKRRRQQVRRLIYIIHAFTGKLLCTSSQNDVSQHDDVDCDATRGIMPFLQVYMLTLLPRKEIKKKESQAARYTVRMVMLSHAVSNHDCKQVMRSRTSIIRAAGYGHKD